MESAILYFILYTYLYISRKYIFVNVMLILWSTHGQPTALNCWELTKIFESWKMEKTWKMGFKNDKINVKIDFFRTYRAIGTEDDLSHAIRYILYSATNCCKILWIFSKILTSLFVLLTVEEWILSFLGTRKMQNFLKIMEEGIRKIFLILGSAHLII